MNLICYSFPFVFISEKCILVQSGFWLTVCFGRLVYHCVNTRTKEKIQLYTSYSRSLRNCSYIVRDDQVLSRKSLVVQSTSISNNPTQ